MASASISLSILNPKPRFSISAHLSSAPSASTLTFFSSATISFKRSIIFYGPLKLAPKHTQFWRISAVSEDALPSDATTQPETAQEVISTGDDGVSIIISVLLFVAFVGLSILTIGVIYLGVTDFLQKREKEKFEKEEAAKKKKGGKKKKVRARAGPKGFGQQINEDDNDDA